MARRKPLATDEPATATEPAGPDGKRETDNSETSTAALACGYLGAISLTLALLIDRF